MTDNILSFSWSPWCWTAIRVSYSRPAIWLQLIPLANLLPSIELPQATRLHFLRALRGIQPIVQKAAGPPVNLANSPQIHAVHFTIICKQFIHLFYLVMLSDCLAKHGAFFFHSWRCPLLVRYLFALCQNLAQTLSWCLICMEICLAPFNITVVFPWISTDSLKLS